MEPAELPIVTGQVALHVPLPVVPLYDLKLAAQLIPCSHGTLKQHLHAHKADFPAVYRREGKGRRVRLLSAREIVQIRAKMLKGPGLERVLEVYPDL